MHYKTEFSKMDFNDDDLEKFMSHFENTIVTKKPNKSFNKNDLKVKRSILKLKPQQKMILKK